jgi:hypothetical protein
MRTVRLLLGSLLLATPLLSRAQTTELAPRPRFYVGLAAYHSNFQNLIRRHGDTGLPVPVQLTAGYQLRPRLALELGVAHSGRSSRYAYDGYYFNATGPGYLNQHTSTTTERATSVSALGRYTLTRQPAHRLQVDVLGGFTLAHGTYYARGSDTNSLSGTVATTPFAHRAAATDFLLTAGLGLRYRLAPRLELNLDLTANRSLTYDGFTGSAALGLRYRFGK